MNQTLKSFITSLGLDVLVVSLVDFLKDQGKEHGKKLIEGWIIGLGTNDEVLFQSACAYAILELGVSTSDISKIVSVIKEYNVSERKRIVEIIGKSEQDVVIKMPVVDKSGNLAVNKKGETIFKETKTTANVRGAQILVFLARMSEEEIRDFFDASGSLNTIGKKFDNVSEKVKEAITMVSRMVNKSVIPATKNVFEDAQNQIINSKKKYENFLSQPTMFEKIAKKFDIFGLLK